MFLVNDSIVQMKELCFHPRKLKDRLYGYFHFKPKNHKSRDISEVYFLNLQDMGPMLSRSLFSGNEYPIFVPFQEKYLMKKYIELKIGPVIYGGR